MEIEEFWLESGSAVVLTELCDSGFRVLAVSQVDIAEVAVVSAKAAGLWRIRSPCDGDRP